MRVTSISDFETLSQTSDRLCSDSSHSVPLKLALAIHDTEGPVIPLPHPQVLFACLPVLDM